MSIFLPYFELIRTKPFAAPAAPAAPVVARRVSVAISGDKHLSPTREGLLLTDGIASDHFLQYNSRVSGRAGEVLRRNLFRLVAERVAIGARPILCFVIAHDILGDVYLPLDRRRAIVLEVLADEFQNLKPLDPIEIGCKP